MAFESFWDFWSFEKSISCLVEMPEAATSPARLTKLSRVYSVSWRPLCFCAADMSLAFAEPAHTWPRRREAFPPVGWDRSARRALGHIRVALDAPSPMERSAVR